MEMVASIGLLLLTIVTSATLEEHRVVRRFAGNEWNWSGQAANAAPQTAAAPRPSAKGDADVGGWSQDDVQQKEEADDDIAWNTRPQGNDKGGAGAAEETGNLEVILRGIPGTDFPDFMTVPDTAFDCAEFPPFQGYYADTEAGCQVFHICQPGNRKDSFLCPLGTVFNQRHLVCDWWFNVNCSESASLYDRNHDIYGDNAAAPALTTTTTTEKPPQMPWSAQDLNKKRPPTVAKGWPMGKQNNAPRKDVATKRGAKSDSAVTAINSWSRSDVQKEVTLSWTTSGVYGSPSAVSSSKASSWNTVTDHAGKSAGHHQSTKPVWYGIDGQPSKDQSDAMRKRTGLLNPPTASFGSRLKSSTSSAFQPTTSPRRTHSASTTARQQYWASTLPDSTGRRHSDSSSGIFPDHPTNIPSRHPDANSIPTGRFPDSPAIFSTGRRHSDPSSAAGFPDPSSTIRPRHPDSTGGFPDTSIVPTGVSGVWEQDTTRTHKGIVTKSESFVHHRLEGTWGERSLAGDPISSSATSAHNAWKKLRKGERLSTRSKAFLHPNSILRRKDRF